MRKTILLYGIAMAVFVGLLKYFEYSFLVKDLSTEFYVGIIAVFFTALGVWAGRKLTRVKIVVTDPDFILNTEELHRLGISRREYEVLELIAQGLSTKEIAEKFFVSSSTIKTHSSNLFLKLNAKRRTQAIQRAKQLRLLP